MVEDQKFEEYIVQKITNRISSWIGKEYPDIGDKLLHKASELKEQEVKLIRITKEYKETMNKNLMDHLALVRSEVAAFMSNDHPNLVSGLNALKCDFEVMIKNFKEKEEWFDNKTKKIYDSQTLYADVYQMKDDVKSLKKDLENLSKKLIENPTLCQDVFRMRDEQKEIKTELETLTKKLKNLFK